MFTILKITNISDLDILNVVYGNDISLAYSWITDTLSNEIKSLSLIPPNTDELDINYIVEFDNDSSYTLIKRYKKVKPGYLFNSYSTKNLELYKIKILKFSNINLQNCKQSILYNNLNNEINNRVLNSLDKESLFQIFTLVQNIITSKESWNYTEYNSILSDVLHSFKREFYSSIAKRARRYGK